MIVGEAKRRVEIRGFLMAGSFFLAPDTYVLIVRFAFLAVRKLLQVSYIAMSHGANISPRWEDAMK
jgi:pilus assembly protein TadC